MLNKMIRIFVKNISTYVPEKIKPNIRSCMKNCQCITCWRYQSSTPLIAPEELQAEYEQNIISPPSKKHCNCRCIWCGWPQNVNPP
jgi:hypothetical protein